MKSGKLCAFQVQLKDQYREAPQAALVSLG